MNIRIFLLLLFHLFACPAFGQKEHKNSLAIGTEFCYTPRVSVGNDGLQLIPLFTGIPGDQFTLSYERVVTDKLKVGVTLVKSNDGMMEWANDGHFTQLRLPILYGPRKMIEAHARYNLLHTRHHIISVSGGLSFKQEQNRRIVGVDSITYYPSSGPVDSFKEPYNLYGDYIDYLLGAVVGGSYDYSILKGRAAIGASLKWRAYLTEYFTQFSSGLYLKFNF